MSCFIFYALIMQIQHNLYWQSEVKMIKIDSFINQYWFFYYFLKLSVYKSSYFSKNGIYI